MKAVVLAAGKGTRMRPLTGKIPKPLLPVAGKPLIDHTVEQLREKVEETIVVTGYRKEEMKEHFTGVGDVTVIEQEEPLGTANAALKAGEHVDGRTVILNGDDIYRIPWEEVEGKERIIGVAEVDDPGNYGVVQTDNGKLKGIEEKPDRPDSRKVNTGFYVVEEGFFHLLEKVERSERGEYEITDAVREYGSLETIELEEWIPCSYPWQLLEANERIIERTEREIAGEVADTATIKGDVRIEENAEIGEKTVIEGPVIVKSGAEVGPGSYIRPGTVLHQGSYVANSEIKNSVVGPGSQVPHFSYVGDSYLSRTVNLGAGTKTANVRNDGRDIKIRVKGEYKDTGREKLGAFIASNVKIGVNCSINPGTLVGNGVRTDSAEKLKGRIPAGSTIKDGEIDEDRD